MKVRKLRFLPSIFVITAVFLLGTLGTWQTQRLQWKTALIAKISAQQSATSLPFIPSLTPEEFRRVTIKGRFLTYPPIQLMGKMHKGKLGIHNLYPFQTETGKIIVIDLGWQLDKTFKKMISSETQTLMATVRFPQAPGVFTPDNDLISNQWYWVDLPNLAAHWDLPIEPNFYLAFNYAPPPLRNNHLGYAVTWYSLAAVLMVFIWLHRQRFYSEL